MILNQKRLESIANHVHKSKPHWSDIEDDVSLCNYIRRTQDIELTLDKVAKIRVAYDKVAKIRVAYDAIGRQGAEAVSMYVVIDCTDALGAVISKILTYPKTPKGKIAARATFAEWVRDSADDSEEISEERMDVFFDEGKFEVGEGYILFANS